MQIAAILADDLGIKRHATISFYLHTKLDPHEGAFKVHKLTRGIVNNLGVPQKTGLMALAGLLNAANTIVGHNVDFDWKMLQIAYAKHLGTDIALGDTQLFCTMRVAKSLSIPGNLGEAYAHLTGTFLQNQHDALSDAEACLTLYRELRE